MKILMLLSLVLSTAMANCYDFSINESSIRLSNDESYELEKNINIRLKAVTGTIMAVTLNGVTKNYDVSRVMGTGTIKLNKDVLYTSVCSEQESVEYVLNFDQADNTSAIKNVKLSAVNSYTYDWCHASTEKRVYNYTLK